MEKKQTEMEGRGNRRDGSRQKKEVIEKRGSGFELFTYGKVGLGSWPEGEGPARVRVGILF